MKFAVVGGAKPPPFVAHAVACVAGRGIQSGLPMHHRQFRWPGHNTLLSVSSLVWIAAAGAPALAQGENQNQNQPPPASATPQPPASPAVEPAQPQGGAGPAPTQPPATTPATQPAAGN